MSTRVREAIRQACRTATDPVALHREVAGLLPAAVPFGRWSGLVVDPATLLSTGGYHREGLPLAVVPRLMEIEAGRPDVNALPALSRTRTGVSTIHRATRGNTAASARYRDVLEPSGLGRELRAVLRDRRTAWGGLILLRETSDADFSDADLAFVAGMSADLARGIRRCLLLSELEHRDAEHVPGMAVIALDGDEVRADVVTSAARHWLADVSDGEVGASGLPFSVVSLAMCARTAVDGVVSTRLRSRAGRWLSLHAEVVEPGPPVRVSLVVEPTRPHELAEVIARAYGLSEREREVARMAVSGHSNQEIAESLWLSPWTVQDHLKNAFAKLGVRNRAEMTARMFFDQYVPRLGSGAPFGGDGWFAEP